MMQNNHNLILHCPSFGLGRLKLEKSLKQRTIRISDSALFSDHIGYCEVLLDTNIDFVNIENRKINRSLSLYTFKLSIKDGKMINLEL